MDVGNNLTVASLQDQYDSKNHSWNAGIDVTVGYGFMISGNVGIGKGKTESDWVGQQTSIVGREEVDIYVENNTHIKGAIIATDPGGSLTLNTNTISFEQIKDKDKGYDWAFGVSVSTNFEGGFDKGDKIGGIPVTEFTPGKDTSTNKDKDSNIPIDNISGHYAAHDKQGVLRPTVTEGNIIVRSNPDAESYL